MLELMLQLESIRNRLKDNILPTVSSNDYHLVSTILALIFSAGTLVTGFTIATVSVPFVEFSLVAFVVGILAVLSIILLPVGIIIL